MTLPTQAFAVLYVLRRAAITFQKSRAARLSATVLLLLATGELLQE